MRSSDSQGISSDVGFDPFAGPAILATAPTTEPQREIWTATLLGDDASLAYNESITLTLRGELDEAALVGSVRDLVQRHESLRTTFTADGTTLCVLADIDSPVQFEDMSQIDSELRASRVAEHCAKLVEQPFDLLQGPLYRVTCVKLGPAETLVTFTAHHIIFDGFSSGILVTDWGNLYSARRGAKTTALAPAEAFSSYAAQEKRAVESNEREVHERYWLDQFQGEIPILELPYDRPRPQLKTYASRRLDIVLDPELVRDVKALGAKQGASLFATLLGSFGLLMSRLSGQNDVVVGIPAAGQSVGGHDTLIGHCVNMLPFRGNYAPEQSLRELLGATRKNVLDAYDHQEYTFGSLLKKLTIARDPSRLPLVTVVFNLDRGLLPDDLHFDGLEAVLRTNPRHFENFDLFINAVDLRDRVVLECQYNTDLFDERTVTNWFDSYKVLLRSFVQHPDTAIGDFELLSEADRTRLARWNDTQAKRFDVECIHQLIEAQTDRTPDQIAVEFEGSAITYRQLDRRSNQLAVRLRQLGVKRDILVGLCLERSIDMVVGLVAVHKAGGGYVPLDPGYPRDRLTYMVEDSAMPVLITDKKLHEELALSAKHVLCIDEQAAALAQLSDERLGHFDDAADAESLAYVIYTSGSTGKPKGVLIEHRSVVNLLGSLHLTPGLTDKDVVLAITTLSFDIAVSELILPLTAGAKILLVSRDVASDGSRLMQAISQGKVSFIDATPATYRLLLAAGWTGDPSLRVICTGEALPRDLAVDLAPKVRQLWNGYGPTETTVWSTFFEVTRPVGRILIGRPVDNTQIHILDGRGHHVPVGVTGEMFIGGLGLARGYLNRPELTAERFLPDPFARTPGSRMYRSGDLARYLPDGNIECLGRNDNQVKLRGYRIELGEIENALAAQPGIESAAVIVREDRPGDKRLCAYYVAPASISESDLRAQLKQSLPDYMVPQHFTVLPRMPLTPSGKVDRKALPAPVGESRASEDYVEPSTPSEKLVAELWKQALVMSRISANDDFFALGGHSLLASQILSRLRVEHGVVIPFRKMFEAPTITAFARLVDESGLSGTNTAVQRIPRGEYKNGAPLSPSQERLWRMHEMDPNSWRPHVLPAAWRLRGPLDVPNLKRAIQYWVDRHELLRTSFHEVDGKPIQRIAASLTVHIEERDFSNLLAADREAQLVALFDTDADTPYDLSVAPLFRTILIRVSENEHVLYSSRHNIIWDGWSFDLYLRDISVAYTAFCKMEEPQLPAIPIAYADFGVWYKEWLKGPEHEKQLAYWKKQFETEVPPLTLPTDRDVPKARNHMGANGTVKITMAEVERLTAIGHEGGATLYTVLLSAYAVLLHTYTGQKDFLIGTPVRARTRPEMEDIIGLFVNTLALRINIRQGATFMDLVAQVRDTTLDAFSNQESPLEALEGKAPALRVSFSLQDARTRPTQFANLEMEQHHVMHRSAVNDLTLWAMYSLKQLTVVLNYSTEMYNEATIRFFLDGYRTLITSILANPNSPIDSLQIVSADALEFAQRAGRSKSLTGSNLGATFSKLLENRASAAPDSVALSDSSKTVTYARLCGCIDRGIAQLTSAGVSRGTPVMVLGSRGLPSLVAAISVIEASAHLVLVDENYPPALVQRIRAAIPGARVVVDDSARQRHAQWLSDPDAPQTISLAQFGESSEPQRTITAAVPGEHNTIALRIPYLNDMGELAFGETTYGELLALATDVCVRTELGANDTLVALDGFAAASWILEMLAGLVAGASNRLIDDDNGAPREVDGKWLESVKPTVVLGPSDILPSLCLQSEWKAPVAKIVATGRPLAGTTLDTVRMRTSSVYNTFAFEQGTAWNTLGPITEPTTRYRIGSTIGERTIQMVDELGKQPPICVPAQVEISRGPGKSVPTGDVARILADGTLEYQGPRPGAVWLRGCRVALGAIRARLTEHPALIDAVAVVIERGNDTPVLVGYVVPKAGENYTESELRRHLRQTLPEDLVPQDFVEVAEIPRGADGTVDTSKLPSSYVQATRPYIAPRNAGERLLAEVWQTALKLDKVSADDNFFNLGGHSLLCFQVIDEVQKRSGVRLSPRNLLFDTLDQVAKALNATGPEPPTDPEPGPEPVADTSLGGKLFGKLRKIARV